MQRVMKSKAGGGAHLVHFGVLLHDALVVLGVVPVPAIPLPIVVQRQVQLSVLVRSYTRSGELGSHFPGPLVGKNVV